MGLSATRADRVFRFEQFELSEREGALRKNGARIRLQEQPFQVLVELLADADRVVTREHLQQKLWPADTFVDFDVGLNTAIRKLRLALGDDAESPRSCKRSGFQDCPYLQRQHSDYALANGGASAQGWIHVSLRRKTGAGERYSAVAERVSRRRRTVAGQ